jgi:hypothetical protein
MGTGQRDKDLCRSEVFVETRQALEMLNSEF